MAEEAIEEKRRETSLRDVYAVLFRHKWKMVLFLVTVVGVVTVGTLCRPDVFRSEAKLLVRLGRESVTLDPTATTGQTINISESRQSQINSELEILKTREIAEKVVDAIGTDLLLGQPDEVSGKDASSSMNVSEDGTVKTLDLNARDAKQGTPSEPSSLAKARNDREMAVCRVMSNLDVEVLKDTSVIDISYDAQTPELAQDVLTKLIDLYLEKHIAVHQTPGSYQFFDRQSEALRDKLAQTEAELQGVRDVTGVSSLEDQRPVILRRIGDLEQVTGDAEAELAASKAKVQELQKTLGSMPNSVVTDQTTGYSDYGADLIRARLFELRVREQNLASKFTEDSRTVQMIRQEVAEAQALLDKENAKPARAQITVGVNSAYQQVQSQLLTEQAILSSLQAKVQNLKTQLATAKAGLRTLNDADLRITRLERDMEIQAENYRRYCESLEQARIDNALEMGKISSISVVQPATFPIKPVGPRRLLSIALGFLLGIFGSVFLAIFSEYVDHSIKTPAELEEKLQLPAAAYIPWVGASSFRPIVRRRAQVGPSSRLTVGASTHWLVPAKVKEHYEILRERVLLHPGGSADTPRVLAVVGCRRGEGTTTIAANLAATLATHNDGPVLLIDTNMSRPCVHRIFNTALSPGLFDTLLNGQHNGDAIRSSPIEGLHVFPAGTVNGNISEVFDPSKLAKLLKSMKNRYRFVVVDVPPAYEVSWAARLAGFCDGVVFVVEAERLRWEVAEKAKVELLGSKADVIGAILNKRRFHIPEWLYQTL